MSASSTTELYHSVPSTANAVGASALFVALNTFQFVARKSLLVSPAGAAYKFVVSEVLKPISAKCPLVSAILKSPPFECEITTLLLLSTLALTFVSPAVLIAPAITSASVAIEL